MPKTPYEMYRHQYQTYRQQSVMTMTQGEMLKRLYDEIITQLNAATIYIKEKEISKTNEALKKSQKIFYHLKGSLDFQYEVSNNLNALYDFFIEQTIQANVKKDATPLADVIEMVTDLRDTFVQADRLSRGQ